MRSSRHSSGNHATLSPLDFLLGVMRDSSVSPDWRFKAAQAALPYIHSKPPSSPAADPAVSAKQVEGMSEEEKRARDRMHELSFAKLCGGDLSSTEAEELESLRKAYPSDPVDDDPIYQALCQALADEKDRIERLRAAQKVKISSDVDGALVSDGLLD